MSFIINGIPIKNPSTFKLERYNVTTLERLSNADMVGDLLAKKLKFYFAYEAISASDFNKILDAIWETPNLFFKLEYPLNGQMKSCMVYAGSIPSELHRGTNGSDWVWRGVTFNLIER